MNFDELKSGQIIEVWRGTELVEKLRITQLHKRDGQVYWDNVIEADTVITPPYDRSRSANEFENPTPMGPYGRYWATLSKRKDGRWIEVKAQARAWPFRLSIDDPQPPSAGKLKNKK